MYQDSNEFFKSIIEFKSIKIYSKIMTYKILKLWCLKNLYGKIFWGQTYIYIYIYIKIL